MVIIMFVFLLINFCGCNQLLPTDFKILSKSTREGYDNLDYTLYIDLTLINKGGDGEQTVWCKLTQGDNFWTKKEAVYLNNEAITNITFTFTEISFWTPDNSSYEVWIE